MAYFQLGHLSKTHAIYLCICWAANTQGKHSLCLFVTCFIFQFGFFSSMAHHFHCNSDSPRVHSHWYSTHNKTDRQTNAEPSNTAWSMILYMPISNWINMKWFYKFYFFSLTDVLHHERVMMEGKMNCHWHISSCIAILNIRDICQKTCHRFCHLFFADDLKGKFEIGTYFSQWGLWPQDLA